MLTTKGPVISLSSGEVVTCKPGHIKVLLSAWKLFLSFRDSGDEDIKYSLQDVRWSKQNYYSNKQASLTMTEIFASISWIILSAKWAEKGFQFLLCDWICLKPLLLTTYDIFDCHAFPEGDPVGHKIIRNSPTQMWLWRTTESWQHGIYHIFERHV